MMAGQGKDAVLAAVDVVPVRYERYVLAVATASLALLFGLYFDTARSLFELWRDDGTYSHGFLVVPIALYLIYRQRHRLRRIPPRPSWLGVVLVAGMALSWAVFRVIHVEVGTQLAFVTMVAALVIALWGWRMARVMVFPLLFPLFAVPVWGMIVTVPLQNLTAWAAYHTLVAIGIPTAIDGHFIFIPEGVFEIATACAGTRYFIVGLTLGALFSYMMYRSWRKHLLFVGAIALASILANVVRVVIVIVAGHMTDMQHAWVRDHNDMGWVIFLVFAIPLFWVGMRFADPEAVPESRSRERSVPHLDKGHLIIPVATLLALVSGPLLSMQARLDGTLSLPEAPPAAGGWRDAGVYEGPWTAGYIGADGELAWRYLDARGEEVIFYVASYGQQAQGKELADAFNRPYDREQWHFVAGGEPRRIVTGVPWPSEVRSVIVQSQRGERMMVWQWYSVAGVATVHRKYAKLLELRKLFGSDHHESMALVVATPVEGDVESARRRLNDFVSVMGERMKRAVYGEIPPDKDH